MKKAVTALLALAIVISITGLCFSFDKKSMFTRGLTDVSWWKNDSIVEKLDLTNTQVQELEEIKYAYGKKMIKAKSSLDIAQIDLKHELSKDEVDTEVIDNYISEISKAHNKILKNKIYKKLALKKVLTKEQADSLKKELRKFMKGKMEQHGKSRKEKLRRFMQKHYPNHPEADSEKS